MFLTPKQVAAQLSVSPRTVYAWIDEGRLTHVRLSERVTRIPSEAVDALVTASTVPAVREVPAAYVAAKPSLSPSERLRALVHEHRDEIVAIVEAHNASNPRLFGSVARGDAGPESDIDILIDPGRPFGYLALGGISVQLEELLGHKVDVIPSRTIRPEVRANIMRDLVPL